MTEHRERTVEEAECHRAYIWHLRAEVAMSKELKTALNMAKFIQGQSLLLLDRLNELNLDDDADLCDGINDSAEQLYHSLSARFDNLQDGN